MTEAGGCPVVHFDHNSARALRRPGRVLPRAAREGAGRMVRGARRLLGPVQLPGRVRGGARRRVFSSARTSYGGEGLSVVIPKTPMHLHIPIEIDPPDFRKWRKLINPITAPAAVDRMEGMVEHYVSWFIDQVIESGECRHDRRSSASRRSSPSTGSASTSRTGSATRRRTTPARAEPGSPEYQQAVEVDFPYLDEQMREVIARAPGAPAGRHHQLPRPAGGRRPAGHRRRGVLDRRPAARRRRRHDRVAGQPDTVVWLYQHPDVRRQLIDDPSLLDKAIEEFLRLLLPHPGAGPDRRQGHRVPRLPDEDGRPRAAGLGVGEPRRAEQFENPDELDITRWPNRHMAFGIGVHRCAGSHLGRAMAKEMLTQILERMPRLRRRRRRP